MITQFIYNLLTSSNNHLLLQLCRWLALALEQAPAEVTTTMTYHYHRQCLRMNYSHSSWVIREPCRIHYDSLRRTPLMPVSNIKGLSQINTALSRISKTPSLLSSKWPKNRSRWMIGLTQSSKSSVYWGLWNIRRQNMSPVSCRDRLEYGGPFPVISTYQLTGHMGAIQVSL